MRPMRITSVLLRPGGRTAALAPEIRVASMRYEGRQLKRLRDLRPQGHVQIDPHAPLRRPFQIPRRHTHQTVTDYPETRGASFKLHGHPSQEGDQ